MTARCIPARKSQVACLVVAAVVWRLLNAQTAYAHDPVPDDLPPPKVTSAILYRPLALSDRIVLTWTGDPATTQTVTWRTSTEVSRAYAEIAEAEPGPQFKDKARRIDAATRPFTSDLYKCHVHTATFEDLAPATRYAYRVGDTVNWSEWFQFRTAGGPASAEPFSFVYFGDAQNEIRSLWSRVIREAYADAPRAAFMLHAGDLVNRAESDELWGEWFGAGGWINAMVPVVATPGNHEYASREEPKGNKIRWLSRHWSAQFAFPPNGPEGLENSVYYVDYQNLRLFSLNSNEKQKEQIPWLERALAESDREWTVVTFHHPIYSMAKDRDNPDLRKAWQPVFDRHSVDLVLTGHDHSYGRTGLVGDINVAGGANWRSSPTGTVYVVSVSGPKMYDLDKKPRAEMRRVAEDTQLYQIITIDGNLLHYEARTASGELYDGFTLEKQQGKPNHMIEQRPDTPERRRPATTRPAKSTQPS